MFDNHNSVALRFNKIEHLGMEKDEKDIDLIKVQLELNPLTVKKAEDLSGFMRRMLFTSKDAEVTSELDGASFRPSDPYQDIVVRMAPDQREESFTILEGKIGTLHVRRSRKSSAWRLVFTVTFMPASRDVQASVIASRAKTRYCTFADAKPDLFSASSQKRTRAVRAEQAQGIGPAAEATH